MSSELELSSYLLERRRASEACGCEHCTLQLEFLVSLSEHERVLLPNARGFFKRMVHEFHEHCPNDDNRGARLRNHARASKFLVMLSFLTRFSDVGLSTSGRARLPESISEHWTRLGKIVDTTSTCGKTTSTCCLRKNYDVVRQEVVEWLRPRGLSLASSETHS